MNHKPETSNAFSVLLNLSHMLRMISRQLNNFGAAKQHENITLTLFSTFTFPIKPFTKVQYVKWKSSFSFSCHLCISAQTLQNLKAAMAAERTKGFSHVVVASNLRDGFSLLIQSAGLGGMKHNTVLMAWPAGWTEARDPSARRNFIGKHNTQERLERSAFLF